MAPKRFSRETSSHQGRSWDKRPNPQFRAASEHRLARVDNPIPPDQRVRDVSANRGCWLFGSWRHEDLFCSYKNNDAGSRGGNPKGDKRFQGCFFSVADPTSADFVGNSNRLMLLMCVVSQVPKINTRTKTPECQRLFTQCFLQFQRLLL